jgi:hypothetical protein
MSIPPAAKAGAARGVRRTAATVGLAAVLLGPLSVIFIQFWSARSVDLGYNEDERRGLQYLRPLSDLISTLTEQQSDVVHGRPVEALAVQQATAAVDAAERSVGARLQTTQRWGRLRQSVLDVTAQTFTDPRQAFTAYSGVIDVAVALLRKVGDTSRLILDPSIDAYYVMNATLLRIPLILVDSGRYSDMVRLASSRRRSVDAGDLAQLAGMRSRIMAGADDLVTGLEKSFESTTSDTLGPALVRQLDDFRTAVDTVAPRRSMVEDVPPTTPDPRKVESAQDDLQRVTLGLDRAAIGQLDVLLKARVDTIARDQLYAVLALLAGLLVSVAVAVWLGPARWRPTGPPHRPTGRSGEQGGGGEHVGAGSLDAQLQASPGLAMSARRGGSRAAR